MLLPYFDYVLTFLIEISNRVNSILHKFLKKRKNKLQEHVQCLVNKQAIFDEHNLNYDARSETRK